MGGEKSIGLGKTERRIVTGSTSFRGFDSFKARLPQKVIMRRMVRKGENEEIRSEE